MLQEAFEFLSIAAYFPMKSIGDFWVVKMKQKLDFQTLDCRILMYLNVCNPPCPLHHANIGKQGDWYLYDIYRLPTKIECPHFHVLRAHIALKLHIYCATHPPYGFPISVFRDSLFLLKWVNIFILKIFIFCSHKTYMILFWYWIVSCCLHPSVIVMILRFIHVNTSKSSLIILIAFWSE